MQPLQLHLELIESQQIGTEQQEEEEEDQGGAERSEAVNGSPGRSTVASGAARALLFTFNLASRLAAAAAAAAWVMDFFGHFGIREPRFRAPAAICGSLQPGQATIITTTTKKGQPRNGERG